MTSTSSFLTRNIGPPAMADAAVVRDEEIDHKLTAYVRGLTAQRPYWQHDFMISEDNSFAQLELIWKEMWPEVHGQDTQTRKLLRLFDKAIHNLPVKAPAHQVMVRIIVSAKPVVPTTLPAPHESSSIIGIDAEKSVAHSCTLPALDEPPPMEKMGVKRGILATFQPRSPVLGRDLDNLPLVYGATENLYGTRQRDPLVSGDDWGDGTSITLPYPDFMKLSPALKDHYLKLFPGFPGVPGMNRAMFTPRAPAERGVFNLAGIGMGAALELMTKAGHAAEQERRAAALKAQEAQAEAAGETAKERDQAATKTLQQTHEQNARTAEALAQDQEKAGAALQGARPETTKTTAEEAEKTGATITTAATLAAQTAEAESEITGSESGGPERPETAPVAAAVAETAATTTTATSTPAEPVAEIAEQVLTPQQERDYAEPAAEPAGTPSETAPSSEQTADAAERGASVQEIKDQWERLPGIDDFREAEGEEEEALATAGEDAEVGATEVREGAAVETAEAEGIEATNYRLATLYEVEQPPPHVQETVFHTSGNAPTDMHEASAAELEVPAPGPEIHTALHAEPPPGPHAYADLQSMPTLHDQTFAAQTAFAHDLPVSAIPVARSVAATAALAKGSSAATPISPMPQTVTRLQRRIANVASSKVASPAKRARFAKNMQSTKASVKTVLADAGEKNPAPNPAPVKTLTPDDQA